MGDRIYCSGRIVASCGVALALFASVPARSQDPGATDDRAARLAEMARVARKITIAREGAGAKATVALAREALHRWNDPTREFSDGTLWAWGAPGRPLALATAELYPRTPLGDVWSCELVALGSVTAEFDGPFQAFGSAGARVTGGPRLAWTPTSSSVKLQRAPEPAPVAGGGPARLREMTGLAQRFTASEVGDTRGKFEPRYELRLMPHPVLRYRDESAGLVDGALFLFAHGTNPEFVLLVEARRQRELTAWWYGFARLSRAALFVQLDGKEVWTQPFATRPLPSDPYVIVSILRDNAR